MITISKGASLVNKKVFYYYQDVGIKQASKNTIKNIKPRSFLTATRLTKNFLKNKK